MGSGWWFEMNFLRRAEAGGSVGGYATARGKATERYC